MATTNIDSVAEFKVLTNSYAGRVRPRGRRPDPGGHQERHAELPRVGLLVRPALGLECQHVDQQARDARRFRRPRPRATTAATRSAGRSSSRASTRTRRSCSSSSARSTSGAPTRRPSARRACPPRSSGGATSRRASTRAATRSPTFATTRRDCPAAPPTRAAASRTVACSAGFPPNRLYQPGLAVAEHLPAGQLLRAAAASTSRARIPTARRAARTCCGWTSRSPTSGGSPAGT